METNWLFEGYDFTEQNENHVLAWKLQIDSLCYKDQEVMDEIVIVWSRFKLNRLALGPSTFKSVTVSIFFIKTSNYVSEQVFYLTFVLQ